MISTFCMPTYCCPLIRSASLATVLLAVFACGCTPEKKKTTSTTDSPTLNTAELLRSPLPPSRDQSYVGSTACAECHEKISGSYAQHPMGMSIAAIRDLKLVEKESPDWLDISGPDRYRADLTTNAEGKPLQLVHQQQHRTSDGTILGDIVEPIAFAIGSGQKGRAYFIFKDQMLFQSPIGWYTAKSCWDLSPGYSPERHFGFQRRIDNSCLYCHAGRVDNKNDQQFSTAVFHEAVIGCERCHGPGEKHIAFHRARAAKDSNESRFAAEKDPICNPVDLPFAAREDVCNQCHLQAEQVIPRLGRSFFDFRPGDRLEDVFVIFLSISRQESRGNFRAVSHVEQMRSSRCYQAAPEKMGCISCHDPHRIPSDSERIQFYRQSCLKCHQDQGCSLALEDRKAKSAEDSCIDCHMPKSDIANVPHTAQTDHRISRLPNEPSAIPTSKNWTVVDGAEDRLPSWEISRARGLAMMTTALKKRDKAMGIKAREYLLPESNELSDHKTVIASLANDPQSLAAIGSSYWLEGVYANARPYWEKTLEVEPFHETALSGLAQIDLDSKDLPSAERRARQLTDFAPAEASHWVLLAEIQWNLNQYDAAIHSAENAIKLDPNLDDTRAWLIQAKEKRDNLP